MTPEQPPSPSRRPRPGADARRRALGVEGSPEPAAPPAAPPARESLRESLARIPDLAPDDDLLAPVGAAAAAPAAPAASVGTAEPAAPAAPASTPPATTGGDAFEDRLRVAFTSPTPPPSGEPDPAAPVVAAPLAADASVAAGGAAAPIAPAPATGRVKPPMWRRITFAVVLVGLVAAIPVLVYAGSKLISDSKSGDFAGTQLSPTDPGYEAQVDPTPTAVAIQYDGNNVPNGVTFMALSGAEGGGSVIFVPLDTEVTEPSFGVNKLRTAYSVVADRPELARERLASQVGRILNVGVDEVIDLGGAGWSQLVAPVAPLTIDNPVAVDIGYGVVIPEGQATLTADQVGLFLAAKNPGESDLIRLKRHQAVWSAWLDAVAKSGKADAVPGESTAGISKFAQALAKGPVSYEVLPVTVADDVPNTFRADKDAVSDLITNTVASPTAAVPGSRFTVRLLNGVSPDSIPSDLVRQVVSRGGAVTILGNGPQFDTDKTTIVYANPAKKNLATLIAKSIGATGTVRLDREAPDTVDLTIVLGKDILGDATGSGTPGATTPDATAPGD